MTRSMAERLGGKPGKGARGRGDARRHGVGAAVHEGGDGGGEVAALGAVVGQAAGHEQGPQVGVAQPQGPEVMGVAGDGLGGIAGLVHQDFLGQDGDVHGMPEGGGCRRSRPSARRGSASG